MYELQKTYTFEAGHALELHDGKCRRPHGHSYVFIVHLESDGLIEAGPKKNMVLDFGDLDKVVEPMVEEYLDHRWLNETLGSDSPTCEYIACWIFEYLEERLDFLSAVTVYETAKSKVIYRRKAL